VKTTKSIVPNPAESPQVREPILRLLRHLDPKEPLPPTSIAAVEAYKRKFIRRLEQQLSTASEIISGALVADGRSEPAARAEVDRFSREIARVVREFELESMSRTMAAEELEQAQEEIGLASVKPLQSGGRA
jgi:hypothetical protein